MNDLTDIMDDVARLNAERRGKGPEQPAEPPTEPTAPATAQPPVEAGPPRLLGIDIKFKAVGTTLGNFELTDDEITRISRIALRGVERALKQTYNDMAGVVPTPPLRVVKRKRRGKA